MTNYNILLLGSGGREHALAWKMAKSENCGNLYIAPGNGGTGQAGLNVSLNSSDFAAVAAFCLEKSIDFLVIGPEAPLVEGIVDYFRGREDLAGVYCIGPSKTGAMLEGSKAFAKEFMGRHNIPTADYQEFTADSIEEGKKFIAGQSAPIVLKADGLAAGKGVVICSSVGEALVEFEEMLSGKFGDAGAKVVVEEFLDGIEFSVFALTDGKDYVILPVAKDYKRIGERDQGLNTGGMGSVSPPSFVDDALMSKVIRRIVEPTINGIAEEGLDYVGFVFFGLIRVNGDPYVIEYNCRMGDPETEVVLPRLRTDLIDLFEAMRDGSLGSSTVEIDTRHATTVICVSGGYPGKYEKGKAITLPAELPAGGILFHAGTLKAANGLVTNGGRVIACTALGDDMQSALDKSNQMAREITFEGKYFRRDIGFDL